MDIASHLLRHANEQRLPLLAQRAQIAQSILNQVPDCARDNRLVKPILLAVTSKGELWVRPLRQAPPPG